MPTASIIAAERAFIPTQEKKKDQAHGTFAAGRTWVPTQEKKRDKRLKI